MRKLPAICARCERPVAGWRASPSDSSPLRFRDQGGRVQIGMIGLGRMGANMAERLRRRGHDVIGYDRDPSVSQVGSVRELVERLTPPRAVWIMVPAGPPTDETIEVLAGLLAKGDTVVDGGNTNFRESMRHSARLAENGIDMLDA